MQIDYNNPDYTEVYKKRMMLLASMRSNPDKVPALKKYYYDNPIAFIEDWVNTTDPRIIGRDAEMPFILFPRQKEFIEWLLKKYEVQENGLVSKCRDIGATWLCVSFAVWLFLFRKGARVGFGSRKQEYVDQIGNSKSILQKARLIMRKIPEQLMPVGFIEPKHATHMNFVNPENGNEIMGEAGDNIGRGDRATMYFKDESAFWERQEVVDAALSQTSNCVIEVSTFNGNGNLYYKKYESGNPEAFEFDWKDDPRKDQAWYDYQKNVKYQHNPVAFAQEIDRDPNKSVEKVCIPHEYIMAAVDYDLPKEGKLKAGLDVADEGTDKNALCWGKGNVVEGIDSWAYGDTYETTKKAIDILEPIGKHEIRYDSVGVGAGVKSSSKRIKKHKGADVKSRFIGISSGEGASEGYFDDTEVDCKDMFLNYRAEMWWRARVKFANTYNHVNGIKKCDPDDMISIPNDRELIKELSQPKYDTKDNGKIFIESKKDMKKRGIKSPNKADALMLFLSNRGAIINAEVDYSINDLGDFYDDAQSDRLL